MTTSDPDADAGAAEPFPLTSGDPGTREQWEAAAAAVLRKSRRLAEDDDDSDVWSALATRTLDDLSVTPLGTAALIEDLDISARPPVREGGWDVRALVADPDPKQANADLLTDLENGVTSLWLRVGADGVPLDGLGDALAGVLLDAAPVVLDSLRAYDAAVALQDVAAETRLAAGSNLGVDPVGLVARGYGEDEVKDWQRSGATMRIAEALGARTFTVDGTVVHDRGASDAQELGYVLAAGAHYLRQYVEHGVDVATAVDAIDFRLAATDEQFLTIAKLRAVRRLWARMLELSGVPEEQRVMRLHVVTSRPMMTRYDPWVNMLRTTVAAFAAGVGGADAVTVLPFDSPLGVPDAFGRRIARNTSALLVEESHVAAVTDPAGGAYAVERLTADLADAAWEELGRLDTTGNVIEALDGFWSRVEDVRLRRDHDIATRKRAVTGLTEFPNLAESLPERRPAADDVRRYGAAFEDLRDSPPEQPVFLATMGPVARHTARASFATNLFAAGGVSVVNAGATEGADDVLSQYDGQRVVCLAGADATYGEWGTELVERLREAGATRVVVAGKPGDLGVDDSCAMGVDALEFLTRTRDALEESA